MEIIIDETLVDTLNQIASDNNLTPEEYASGIVRTFLESQFRGKMIEQINQTSVADLSTAKESIDTALQVNKIILNK